MTVITDSKKRVTLPAKPGERFDVQSFGGDKYVLTRLAPVEPAPVRLVKRHGYTVALSGRKITNADVQKAMEEFP
jgi:hypothetical protein